jgi:hypothetical protein
VIKTGAEAKLYYSDGHFDVLSMGDHVRCAVTGTKIPLVALRYWSVEAQEAYLDGEIATRRAAALAGHNAQASNKNIKGNK